MPKNSNKKQAATRQRVSKVFKKPAVATRTRVREFLSRRPHRSFRITRRRDYRRSLVLPGYMTFTHQVNQTLWSNRKIFVWLGIVYALLTVLFIGIGSQENYTALTDVFNESGSEFFAGGAGALKEAGILFLSIASSGLGDTLTASQQLYAVILVLLVWLTTVWLLRNIMAGKVVKMRDGLYAAGAPIVSTFLVALVLVIQLLPVAIAIVAYSAASASGLLTGGVEAMLFWAGAILLGILSLYLVTSTFFAMIIVTLPGMYPMRALRSAGDIVTGRRIRIFLRYVWMFLYVFLIWTIIVIPFILLDSWLKSVIPQIEWVPVIPVLLLLLSSITVIWIASYIYILYRKVVDDDAKPA